MDSLPCPTAHDAHNTASRPPLGPLNKQQPSSTVTKLKTKKTLTHLPHPLSLNVLPSPTNKWSATTHPIKGYVLGYLGFTISYHHFYFHNDQVLQTEVFSTSTTATTIGDGGEPHRSTELDAITGHNCAMTKDNYTIFAIVVLGVRLGRTHRDWPSKDSFINLLLCDYVMLTNLTAVFALNETIDRRGLAQILARFSPLMLGAKALTQRIIE
jgi:hypothetical protein